VAAAISKSVISRGGETRSAKCFDSCSTHWIEGAGSSEQRLRPSVRVVGFFGDRFRRKVTLAGVAKVEEVGKE